MDFEQNPVSLCSCSNAMFGCGLLCRSGYTTSTPERSCTSRADAGCRARGTTAKSAGSCRCLGPGRRCCLVSLHCAANKDRGKTRSFVGLNINWARTLLFVLWRSRLIYHDEQRPENQLTKTLFVVEVQITHVSRVTESVFMFGARASVRQWWCTR